MAATRLIQIDPVAPDRETIADAAGCLRDGGLVAFPTETVYGLGVHALDPAAVRRLFVAKGRPATDPLIVHVESLDAAAALLHECPSDARRLAARFWPGPLTLVMRRSSRVPNEVTAGLDTVAVRVPAHAVARALIAAAGVPVAAPSANLFSRPSPTRASHVLADLRDRIDIILDGGSTDVGVESTVLDLSGPIPTVLRPGAVTFDMLRDLLPQLTRRHVTAVADGTAAPSPGLLSKHYAPTTPLTLYQGDAGRQMARLVESARDRLSRGRQIVILAVQEDAEDLRAALDGHSGYQIIEIGSRGEPASIAHHLYAALREADAAGAADILLCDSSGDGAMDEAVRDRLSRAAATVERVP